MCWNDGENPDAGYYSALFDRMNGKGLIPNQQFNMKRMGIVGYSVGCHMVSARRNCSNAKQNRALSLYRQSSPSLPTLKLMTCLRFCWCLLQQLCATP